MFRSSANTFVLLTPGLLILSVIPLVIQYFVKKKYKQEFKQIEESPNINNYYYQVIFFDYKNFHCKPHIINREECGEKCSYKCLQTLIKFITTAQESVSLCVYLMTFKDIERALSEIKKRGVEIRVITDKVMAKTGASRSQFFQRSGILYRVQENEDSMMHHKFCLIDEASKENAKMFFGTLNLTQQGFCKNFDNLILTNDFNIIQHFKKEFEELWTECTQICK